MLLEKAKISASATDIDIKTLLRYDFNLVNGITNVIRENSITELILGLHINKSFTGSF